ncbi:MAG: putative signal transducing protein [Candidatus Promineifilaceae bacterium]
MTAHEANLSDLAAAAFSRAGERETPADGRAEESGREAGGTAPWEVVAETAGLAQAQILVGRLQSEGLPARAWQEGAGQAIGLTVGLLGVGRVLVPAELAERARAVLARTYDEEE